MLRRDEEGHDLGFVDVTPQLLVFAKVSQHGGTTLITPVPIVQRDLNAQIGLDMVCVLTRKGAGIAITEHYVIPRYWRWRGGRLDLRSGAPGQ
jgi:hypothetical protein